MGFWSRSISFDVYFFLTLAFIFLSLFAVERALSFSSTSPRIRQAVGLFLSFSVAFLIFSILTLGPFSWQDSATEWRKLLPSFLIK